MTYFQEYQWMTSIGQTIYFFQPYDKICIFSPLIDKSIRKTDIDAISDALISQNKRIIFHKIGKGFGLIDSLEKYHELTSNRPFNQYTLQFQAKNKFATSMLLVNPPLTDIGFKRLCFASRTQSLEACTFHTLLVNISKLNSEL